MCERERECVCVCKRERGRERGGGRESGILARRPLATQGPSSVVSGVVLINGVDLGAAPRA